MRPYLATLLLFALAIAGCDSGEPELSDRFEGHPLVGSWTPQSTAQRTFAVVDESQQVVDRHEPGTGNLRITGDATGDLRYAAFVSRDGEVTIFTIDTRFHPFPDRYAFLTITASRATVTAWTDGQYVQYGRSHPYGEPPHTYEDGFFDIGTLTLQSSSGGTVTVTGSLDVPLRTLEAGTEYEVETHIVTDETEDLAFRYVFEPDGRFRAEPLPGTSEPGYAGSWEETADGRLQIHLDGEGTPTPVELDYEVDDDDLTLSTSREYCEGHAACLAQYENQYALIEGSLTQVRQTNGIAFTRTEN
jgi:hypothetical protein